LAIAPPPITTTTNHHHQHPPPSRPPSNQEILSIASPDAMDVTLDHRIHQDPEQLLNEKEVKEERRKGEREKKRRRKRKRKWNWKDWIDGMGLIRCP